MHNELTKKRDPAQALIRQGLHDEAVVAGAQMLEALYRWLYKEVHRRLKPEEQDRVSKALERRGKSVGDLTLDDLTDLFEEVRLYDIAGRELKRDFSFLKKAEIWRDLRKRATHAEGRPGDEPISNQEAEAFLSMVDLYLHQAGLVVEEPSESTELKVCQLALRVQVPWDKMVDFVGGVLMPLRGEGADLNVEVFLTARSQKGLSRATVDHKVKEALNQIGARILDEEEK